MDVWLILGLVIIVVLSCIAGIFAWMLWPTVIGAVWKPTPKTKVRRMLELAEVGPSDTVYDLGSGDGRILLMAAQEFGAKAVGIEADLIWLLWSRWTIHYRGLEEKVRVIWGNFFHQSLEEASVVAVYQGHAINKKLQDKFVKELKPGTRVVSHDFIFEGWTPLKTDDEARIFLYRF